MSTCSYRHAAGVADAGQMVTAIPPGPRRMNRGTGFRSICFRDGDQVEHRCRNERPMTPLLPRAGRRDQGQYRIAV